ncbi:methyl-accepting chemotaxis sensory transducer [Methylorubrum populi]|uniref:Methyl-accepting chemotaxis sensory transducer n=1 Tax=Methylorubrum populi TaxID=223967 RepID=A0A160PLM2_9HYPH|nr:methyl-accepting chemotaxis protein [Methylorubrum populi]BAU92840.1 methyl-accepting chemotaxis sensory transducer [Methylorubrum populi]
MPNLQRISTRLPAATIGLALLSATAMGALSWSSAKSGLVEAAGERLQLAAEARRDAIELVADRMQADFLSVAGHPQVASNAPDLIEALDPAKPDHAAVTAALRDLATPEARLAFEAPGTMYGRRHGKVQEVARRLLADPGYGDLIVVDEQGRIAYTTTKGADFARSLDDPALAGSGLARLVARLKAQGSDAPVFEDFAAYPVGDGPSAFIGRAITKRANVAMGTGQAAERVGFIALRVTPDLFDRTLAKRVGLGETGQIVAAGADGRLRSNPPLNRDARAGAPLAAIGIPAEQTRSSGRFAYATPEGSHMAASAPVSVLGAPWAVIAQQSEAEAVSAASALSRTLALIGLCVLAGTGLAGLLLTRSLVVPLGALTRALQALAARQPLAEVPGHRRRDEIGDIARAVVTIRDMSLEEAAQQLKTTEAARMREEQARRALLRDLADRFEQSVGAIVARVSEAVGGLQASSGRMRHSVESTAARSTSVAGAAQQTAGNVNAVAAAAEELGATVEEIGRQVEQAAGMSAQAVEAAGRTEATMADLAAAANRIGDVVGLVSTIAGQTNLLALNATIEAARAGEAGRGFAVVAAEVKELASQTARATEEIGQQVGAIQAAAGGVSQAIQDIAAQIQTMSGVTTGIATAVEEQGATTQEIVRSMAQASAGTGEVTASIAAVAAEADDAGRAAGAVAAAADALAEQSGALRAEMAQFLSNVRAA